MCIPNGVNIAPVRGERNETKFGLKIGERVKVIEDQHFKGWYGHVRAFGDFNSNNIAVDLDEPPPGHSENGQWFRSSCIQKAPADE